MVGSDANIKSPIPGPARGGLAPRQVKRACERLESDLSGKLSLREIAAEFGLSVSQFSRAFRISTGLPPYQWLLGQRMSAVKQSEARKTAILNSALDCIITIDHEGSITEFNPAAEQTFGYRRDDVLGKDLAAIIVPPSMREKHQRGLARHLVTGEAKVIGRRVEMTAMRANGSEFPVELAISRIPLDGPPSFTGYLRDITERKQWEEELRRSEAFLSEGQRLSRTGSFSWCLATGDIMWSDQVYRIFEFDQAVPVTPELIATRVHPEDVHLLRDMMNRANSAADSFEYEHRLQMPDHSVKYLHLVAHATRNQHDQLEYIGAVQDITKRRLAEMALGEVRSELAHVVRSRKPWCIDGVDRARS